MVYIIDITGNIASTKTTLINYIKSLCSDTDLTKVGFVEEDALEKIWRGNNLFKNFYDDKEKHGYEIQKVINDSMCEEILRLIKIGLSVIVIDRGLMARNNVFGKINCPSFINQLNIDYKSFMDNTNKYYYIRTSPEGCLHRATKRNRLDEKLDIDYLTKIHTELENIFNEMFLTLVSNFKYKVEIIDFSIYNEDIPAELIKSTALRIYNFVKELYI